MSGENSVIVKLFVNGNALQEGWEMLGETGFLGPLMQFYDELKLTELQRSDAAVCAPKDSSRGTPLRLRRHDFRLTAIK